MDDIISPMLRVSFACFLLSAPAAAWDRHGSLTSRAVASLPGVSAPVTVETLDDFAAASGLGGAARFLRAFKLNPTTDLPFGAGEKPGDAISIRRVLEAYTDEPDWGMDQDLFDHYPERWKDDTIYMGGRGGVSRLPPPVEVAGVNRRTTGAWGRPALFAPRIHCGCGTAGGCFPGHPNGRPATME